MKVLRDIYENGQFVETVPIIDIMEATYTGKDMGERSITATVKWPSAIDFQIGDYVEVTIGSPYKDPNSMKGIDPTGGTGAETILERFYIYTMPTIKKTARSLSCGDAFEHNISFYPRQYELTAIQFRDILNQTGDKVIYTGFENVNFYGGAAELMQRVQAVLDEAFGKGVWSYDLADALNEIKNPALERFAFSFSGSSVMDAILKLNDKEGINTTFFIIDRKIFVGYKRPYLCRVNSDKTISGDPLMLSYGKSSHKPVQVNEGGLFSITKAVGKELPITKLYAYGANRNLNRYYCSDRIQTGRYVNRLMLPSFDVDGKTDYILSEEGIKRYGVREGTKSFDEIYPSLRYVTYDDLRQIEYVLKIENNGRDGITRDANGNIIYLEHKNQADHFSVARVQCYKVVKDESNPGHNILVQSAPADDIAVSVHASGKIIRTVLYADQKDADGNIIKSSIERQMAADFGTIPEDSSGHQIVGSCFLIHDPGFTNEPADKRIIWFADPVMDLRPTEAQDEINLHQIQYVDTFWFTDLYKFVSYDQKYFPRDGYSAYCWARTNNDLGDRPGTTLVNELVAVQPVTIEDTSLRLHDKTYQQTFDVYMKDLGFGLDEQNDFGEMVFVFDDVKMSFLDGMLAGREYSFIVPNHSNVNAICAYNDDGSFNEDFFAYAHDSVQDTDTKKWYSKFAEEALENGAYWRMTLKREVSDESVGLILPMVGIDAKAGDHVVFLDLYMPDVYIHAAENRLDREARKYLDANDKGKVNYSVELDKVRIQQVQPYALQLREGIHMRMADDDLSITSENCVKNLFENKQGMLYAKTLRAGGKVFGEFDYALDLSEDKFYTVVVDINYDLGDFTPELRFYTPDGTASFTPDTTSIAGVSPVRNWCKRVMFKFTTHGGFNPSTNVLYASVKIKDDETSSAPEYMAYLVSIEQKNTESSGDIVNYVDFVADSVTIKITDNTRSDDDRRVEFVPQPIREANVTLAESSIASAWATMMNEVKNNAIEVDAQTRFYKNFTAEARQHYRELLQLRDNIFDPDADTDNPCTQTFIHTMMMQVGADSMNYQLHKTAMGANGVASNFIIGEPDDKHPYYWFYVDQDDELDHFVYTQGAQNGIWKIKGNFEQILYPELDESGQPILDEYGLAKWPVYYVCIKCLKDNVNIPGLHGWICSKEQYAVNDSKDPSCWFFNWGILTADDYGRYTLKETRGNAYMYGDNLICGKISSLAYNSWFDLNNGNFALGKVTREDGKKHYVYDFQYIDGILTINGINDGSEDSILERLKLVEREYLPGDNLNGEGNPLIVDNRGGLGNDFYRQIVSAVPGESAVNKTWLKKDTKYMLRVDEVADLVAEEGGDVDFELKYEDKTETTPGAPLHIGTNFEQGDPMTKDGGLMRFVSSERLFKIQFVQERVSEKLGIVDVLSVTEIFENTGSGSVFGLEINTDYIGLVNGWNRLRITIVNSSMSASFYMSCKNIWTMLRVKNIKLSFTLNLEIESFSATGVMLDFHSYTKYGILADKVDVAIVDFGVTNATPVATGSFNISAIPQAITLEVKNAVGVTDNLGLVVYAGERGKTQYRAVSLTNFCVFERGGGSEYIQHLTNALRGTTDIAGGLVMTNLMLLRGEDNKTVTAGMSGLEDDNIAMFAGATYEDAVEAAKNTLGQLGKMIPVLITMAGYGSNIGCFKVESENAVTITSKDGAGNYHRVFITSDDGFGNCAIMFQDYVNGMWTTRTEFSSREVKDPLLSTKKGEIIVNPDERYKYGLAKPKGTRITEPIDVMCMLQSGGVYQAASVILEQPEGRGYKCSMTRNDHVSLGIDNPFTYLATHRDNKFRLFYMIGITDADNNWLDYSETRYAETNVDDADGRLWFDLPLKDSIPYFGAGLKKLRVNIISMEHDYKVAGVQYNTKLNAWNDNITDAEIFTQLKNSISFIDESDVHKTIFGSDGMLIAKSTTAFMMVKNDPGSDNDLKVKIVGLHDGPDGVEIGSVYKGSNGALMIKS